MNAQIRIYPGMEMMAVDMAEVVHAALPESCVVQGCDLRIQDGNVHVDAGRIILKGRLAYVESGTVEPYIVSTAEPDACLCAVCDLSLGENPFQLRILTANDYSNMLNTQDSAVRAADGDTFNTGSGVAVLKMATLTISPGSGVTKITKVKGGKPRHSKNYIDEGDAKVQADLNAQKKKEYEDTQKLILWRKHLLSRVHDSNKFKTWTINYPHCVIKEGETKAFTIPVITYGEAYAYSNGKVTHANRYGENASKSKYKETLYSYPDYDNPNKNVTPTNPKIRSSFHTLATQGPSAMHPIGIAGLTLTNSDNGGKNRFRCRILGWSFSSTRAFVTLYMDPDVTIRNGNTELYKTEYKQAIVDVNITLLYVQEE